MRRPLLSDKGFKKHILGAFLPIVIILIFMSMGAFITYFIQKFSLFKISIIFGTPLLIVLCVDMYNFISLHIKITDINRNGFVYEPILGEFKIVKWYNIFEIDDRYAEEYGDYFIGVNTKIIKKWIEIRAEEGEKIRMAWEEWKASNEEDLNKKNG